MTIRTPSYRLHKARDCAVVTLAGKDHYLGKYGSQESWEKYHRLIAEWLANQKMPPQPAEADDLPITVNQLVLRYWRFVQSYYVKDGKPTSEQTVTRQALRFIRKLYGSTAARDFSPKALKAVRQAMIEHKITTKIKLLNPATGEREEQVKVLRHGLCRKVINKQIGRIRRMFAWAVEEELLPVTVHQALMRVRGLKKGKAHVREKARIKSVSDGHVEAVLPLVPRMIRAMIEVHRLCGGRPQDILEMRAIDIDQTGPVWEYHPGRYKTEHHNDEDDPDKDRVVFLGPKAQVLLKPYLTGASQDYVFSPRRSEMQRTAELRKRRKTPLWPSHLAHQESKRQNRKRAPIRDRYDANSYRQAIRRACLKAGIPVWHPNQLRHSRLTQIRKRFGLEASKACAGHKEIGVTQHYAEKDRTLAHRVMAEVG